jgi:hypothetical protein
MPFNLKAKRSSRPIDNLRLLGDEFSHIRRSDLDGMSDEEINAILRSVAEAGASKETKTALHGTGDTWSPVGPDYNPYTPSPLSTGAPEFGGRWRDDIGSGSHLIDETSGTGGNPAVPAALEKTLAPIRKEYVVRLRLPEDQRPSEEKAKETFGEKGRTDGRSIYVIVEDFENAMKIQRAIPQSVVERRRT